MAGLSVIGNASNEDIEHIGTLIYVLWVSNYALYPHYEDFLHLSHDTVLHLVSHSWSIMYSFQQRHFALHCFIFPIVISKKWWWIVLLTWLHCIQKLEKSNYYGLTSSINISIRSHFSSISLLSHEPVSILWSSKPVIFLVKKSIAIFS